MLDALRSPSIASKPSSARSRHVLMAGSWTRGSTQRGRPVRTVTSPPISASARSVQRRGGIPPGPGHRRARRHPGARGGRRGGDLCRPREGYGNLVEIDHGNGILTRYAHNSYCGSNRRTVQARDELAMLGSTGRLTGPHVHFEVSRTTPRSIPELRGRGPPTPAGGGAPAAAGRAPRPRRVGRTHVPRGRSFRTMGFKSTDPIAMFNR